MNEIVKSQNVLSNLKNKPRKSITSAWEIIRVCGIVINSAITITNSKETTNCCQLMFSYNTVLIYNIK